LKRQKIPITKLHFTNQEEKNLIATLHSGWVTQGPQVERFEKMVTKYVNAKYAIATSSCTAALHLALLACGISTGDEVIVPSFTFVATVNAIIYCGARPVLVDIEPKTYNIDVNKIEMVITKKTKAILCVHQIGLPVEMDKVKHLAKKYKLKVIEDAACALGSKYRGKMIGSIGEITCFSFHPRKVITTGEGGMITTNRKEYADTIRRLRDYGVSVSDILRHAKQRRVILPEYLELGYNYRMPDICASIGMAQMNRLERIIERRISLANRYTKAFQKIPFIDTQFFPKHMRSNCQSYIIRINESSPISRDVFMRELLKRGICTCRIMGVHLEPYFRNMYKNIVLPETEKAVREALLIPIYPTLSRTEQNFIIKSIINIFKEKG
jgi:dTDP-4-amino-4,6-dideoxygalactose transaminase